MPAKIKPAKAKHSTPALTADDLRLWRTRKNLTDPRWSQEFTARWLGVSPRQYKRFESGESRVPLYVIQHIAHVEQQALQIAALRDAF